MNAVVIGFGSIGSKHARLLVELGCKVSVVSKRNVNFISRYKTIEEAFQFEAPEYVVIANKTDEHGQIIEKLVRMDYKGIVLVEKPILNPHQEIPGHSFERLLVGYNLRFHPIIQKIYRFLKCQKIISAQVYVGQYLPDWRSQVDYRLGYSASKSAGGGVLLDLSHELDFINWIMGGWVNLTAKGGHYSHLEIDSDDVFSIMMTTKKCPIVAVQLNYLDRISQRELIINTDGHTIKADLIRGILQIDKETEKIEVERDLTYRLQHLAAMGNYNDYICSLEEGLEVMKIIQAAELAVKQEAWISR